MRGSRGQGFVIALFYAPGAGGFIYVAARLRFRSSYAPAPPGGFMALIFGFYRTRAVCRTAESLMEIFSGAWPRGHSCAFIFMLRGLDLRDYRVDRSLPPGCRGSDFSVPVIPATVLRE